MSSFENLADAGTVLAGHVLEKLDVTGPVIVLAAIPNGAPVAIPVARALGGRAIALPITRTDEGPIIGDLPEVNGLVVVVIDDGVETGSVARAAAIALRDASPSRLILAVPVCSREALAHLSHLYDQIIAVDMPLGRRSLAWHYTTFDTIDDETAERLLDSQ